jgi:P-type Mg2+ transporter
LTPELLPTIITINLSRCARHMATQGVFVRHLNSIENLGSMDVLCTDKTGTVTEGLVTLRSATDEKGDNSPAVLRLAYLNAILQAGLANPLDDAIVTFGKAQQIAVDDISKVGEIPYDFDRRRLSVIVQLPDQPETLMITKGALDDVLNVCDRYQVREQVLALDEAAKQTIAQKYHLWSEQGLRVLGIASKPVILQDGFGRDDEHTLIFCGFLLFFDPPKKDAAAIIANLERMGVQVKIITGDNRLVARHVAELVGIDSSSLMTGAELNTMLEDALCHRAETTSIFAEIAPNQKERLIRALQKNKHVVGYMGDGINDAPALYAADVGISVEDAVDVAKEAAGLVLTQPDLNVLRIGIEDGRKSFANSLKYILTTTSANFGNMLSMAGASIFLPFLPLLAKQILLNNFLSDIPGTTIAGDDVDSEWIEAPRRWNINFIRNFMLVFGLVSSVFDFLTFGLLYSLLRASPEVFRTGWFIESLLTELVIALVVRTHKPFYRSRPGKWLMISTIVIALITLTVPYWPFAAALGFVPLPFGLLALLIGITLLYVAMTEVVKYYFYRHRWGRL